MANSRNFGRYLAQGFGANAIVIYLSLVVVLLWSGGGLWQLMLFVTPIYCFIAGLFGAATAVALWVIEAVIHRKLNIWLRGLLGILFPSAIGIAIAFICGFNDVLGVLSLTTPFVILILPAALLSGSRLNPLGFIAMDLRRDLPNHGWTRALSIVAVPLMRFVSLVGVGEALLCLACQPLPEPQTWASSGKVYAATIIAVVYFAITLTVSLCLPHKVLVTAIEVFINIPIVMFALTAQGGDISDHFLAVVGWVLIVSSAVFLFSQFMRANHRRIVPVTLLEIRLRHALNYW